MCNTVLCGFLLVILCGNTLVLASQLYGGIIDKPSKNNSAESRAEKTLKGLFNYYWKHDYYYKTIKFFFVCAQIGMVDTPGKCTCYNPSSCLNCFRWWTAIGLESVATYGIYMKSKNHSSIPDLIFKHSPYNADWNATLTCTFIDDFTWYGMAYLRVYEWLNDTKWLNRSIDLHDWAWEYGWDDPCGGFWWNNCEFTKYKDTIVLIQMLHLASKLSYMLPNESRFKEGAETIWNWIFSFDNGRGLMADNFLMSTGVMPERCCNSTSDPYTRCHNSRQPGTSYNQGVLMSASAYLYLSTGNTTYLKTGIRALEAILANYTTKEGILVDEPRSYQSYSYSCYAGADPGGDWYSFNGIFMLHLGYFTELLVKNGSLSTDLLTKIRNLVRNTSNAAWTRSSVYPPFKLNDNACEPGSSPINSKLHVPKFHWWWGEDVVRQAIPPDPRYFFHKIELRCAGNDTQIWNGTIGSEINCTLKCNECSNCSKYMYQDETVVEGSDDCWLWSYNRSDHICNLTDYNFRVGVKRPIGDVTCKDRCGSKEPIKLTNGSCYCDADCAKHLDCCLDYADHCLPRRAISCSDHCNNPIAKPIPGGGYCWCFEGCNTYFTDNNSDGSCCPDYPERCLNIVMPTCLDGRTQISALNLFLGHVSVSKIAKIK